MLWNWSTAPVSVTPDGGGISFRSFVTADINGSGSGDYSFNGTLICSPDIAGAAYEAGAIEVSYGLRECAGVGRGVGACDLGFGFTSDAIIKLITDTNDMQYANRIDFVGTTVMYKGEAAIGSSDASAVWRISRSEFATDGDVTTKWANGSDAFDNVWSDRLTLTYI